MENATVEIDKQNDTWVVSVNGERQLSCKQKRMAKRLAREALQPVQPQEDRE